MTLQKEKYIYSFLFILIALLPVSCFKSLTVTNIVYENNFEAYDANTINVSGWGSAGFGPVTDKRIVNYNGNNVLGKFNNNLVELTLNNLPQHTALRVELDLYLHNKWKNDIWKITFDGSDYLLTGFSNDPTFKQSYPNWYGNGSSLSPAGANSQNTQLPGVCSLTNLPNGTSLYKILATVEHSKEKFTLYCSDAGGTANDTCTRSWSIDNLKVSVLRN